MKSKKRESIWESRTFREKSIKSRKVLRRPASAIIIRKDLPKVSNKRQSVSAFSKKTVMRLVERRKRHGKPAVPLHNRKPAHVKRTRKIRPPATVAKKQLRQRPASGSISTRRRRGVKSAGSAARHEKDNFQTYMARDMGFRIKSTLQSTVANAMGKEAPKSRTPAYVPGGAENFFADESDEEDSEEQVPHHRRPLQDPALRDIPLTSPDNSQDVQHPASTDREAEGQYRLGGLIKVLDGLRNRAPKDIGRLLRRYTAARRREQPGDGEGKLSQEDADGGGEGKLEQPTSTEGGPQPHNQTQPQVQQQQQQIKQATHQEQKKVDVHESQYTRRDVVQLYESQYKTVCAQCDLIPEPKIVSQHKIHVQSGAPMFRLDLGNFNLSSDHVLAAVQAHCANGAHVLPSWDLSGNHMNENCWIQVCTSAVHHVDGLDLSTNKFEFGLSPNAINLGVSKLLRTTKRLTQLNMAHSKLGDEGMRLFAAGLSRNTTLRRLNLSENNIGEIGSRVLAEALSKQNKIESLNLSWNQIKMSAPKFVRILCLRDLDLSWNPLGVQRLVARELAEYLQTNTTLLHVTMDNCCFDSQDIHVLAQAVRRNKTLLGIHMNGLEGKQFAYTDARGFVTVSNLQARFTLRDIRPLERTNSAIEMQLRGNTRVAVAAAASPRHGQSHSSAAEPPLEFMKEHAKWLDRPHFRLFTDANSSHCWLCGQWQEQKITWCNRVGNLDVVEAYVHMECDGWLPWKLSQEWVPESDVFSSSPRKLSSRHKIEAWSTVRMLPGTTRTRFFFQLLLRGMGHRYAHKKHNTVISKGPDSRRRDIEKMKWICVLSREHATEKALAPRELLQRRPDRYCEKCNDGDIHHKERRPCPNKISGWRMNLDDVKTKRNLKRMKLNVVFGHVAQTHGHERRDIFMMQHTSIRCRQHEQDGKSELPMQINTKHWRDPQIRQRESADIHKRMRVAFDAVWKQSKIAEIFKTDRSILLSAHLRTSKAPNNPWGINTTCSQRSVKRLLIHLFPDICRAFSEIFAECDAEVSIFGTACERPGSLVTETYLRILRAGNFIHSAKSLRKLPRALKACSKLGLFLPQFCASLVRIAALTYPKLFKNRCEEALDRTIRVHICTDLARSSGWAMMSDIDQFRWSLMEQLEVQQLFHVHLRALKQVFWIKASPCVNIPGQSVLGWPGWLELMLASGLLDIDRKNLPETNRSYIDQMKRIVDRTHRARAMLARLPHPKEQLPRRSDRMPLTLLGLHRAFQRSFAMPSSAMAVSVDGAGTKNMPTGRLSFSEFLESLARVVISKHFKGDVRAAIGGVDDRSGQSEGHERFLIRGRVKVQFLVKLSSLINHLLRVRFVSADKTEEIVKSFYLNLKESLVFVKENPEGPL